MKQKYSMRFSAFLLSLCIILILLLTSCGNTAEKTDLSSKKPLSTEQHASESLENESKTSNPLDVEDTQKVPSQKNEEAVSSKEAIGQEGSLQKSSKPAVLKEEKETNTSQNISQEKITVQEKQDKVQLSVRGPHPIGTILTNTEVEIKEGDTVLDVLTRITKQKNIPMDYSGIKGTAYIKGIGNVYELDYGPTSGWLYRVNGKFSNKSAGTYTIKSGDVIEWLYTEDLGKEFNTNIGGGT
jgi:hypothetical protein